MIDKIPEGWHLYIDGETYILTKSIRNLRETREIPKGYHIDKKGFEYELIKETEKRITVSLSEPEKKEKTTAVTPTQIIKQVKEEMKTPPRPAETEVQASALKIFRELKKELESVKKTSHVARIKTGIEGIDQMTDGGIPENSAVAVVGGPGTGKSVMLMQFLVNGILDYNEPGIYISFEQSIDELRKSFLGLNFPIEELEKKGLIKLLNYDPMRLKRFIKNLDVTLRDEIYSIKAKRIAVDSLTAFSLLFENENEERRGLFDLFSALKRLGMTCFLSTESWNDPATITKSGVIEFISDGIIMLYNLKIGDARVRALEILKMRSISHDSKIVPFRITENGIIIFPQEQIFGAEENKKLKY